jgi:hypothetical protein
MEDPVYREAAERQLQLTSGFKVIPSLELRLYKYVCLLQSPFVQQQLAKLKPPPKPPTNPPNLPLLLGLLMVCGGLLLTGSW